MGAGTVMSLHPCTLPACLPAWLPAGAARQEHRRCRQHVCCCAAHTAVAAARSWWTWATAIPCTLIRFGRCAAMVDLGQAACAGQAVAGRPGVPVHLPSLCADHPSPTPPATSTTVPAHTSPLDRTSFCQRVARSGGAEGSGTLQQPSSNSAPLAERLLSGASSSNTCLPLLHAPLFTQLPAGGAA